MGFLSHGDEGACTGLLVTCVVLLRSQSRLAPEECKDSFLSVLCPSVKPSFPGSPVS